MQKTTIVITTTKCEELNLLSRSICSVITIVAVYDNSLCIFTVYDNSLILQWNTTSIAVALVPVNGSRITITGIVAIGDDAIL